MSCVIRIVLAAVIVFNLSGCLRNDITPMSLKMPNGNRAIIVYGIGTDVDFPKKGFSLGFDEYSFDAKAITGNCWRYVRTDASIPAKRGEFRYVVFDVPAGHYAYGVFNGARPSSPEFSLDSSLSYEAPAGKIVYFGDFVYTTAQTLEVRNSLAAINVFIKSIIPGFEGQVEMAKTKKIELPARFMCMP